MGDITLTAADIDVHAGYGDAGVDIVDGTAKARIGFSLQVTDPSRDGLITLAELSSAGIEPRVTGRLDATLPLSAQLGEFALGEWAIPTVVIRSERLFEAAPEISVDIRLTQDLRNKLVNILSPVGKRVHDVLGQVDSVLATNIPGLGVSLKGLLGLAGAARDQYASIAHGSHSNVPDLSGFLSLSVELPHART